MNSEFFVNVNKLHDQADCFSKEKNLCEQLYSQIRRVKSMNNTVGDYAYSNLMRKVRALADFYGNMKNAANTTADDVERVLTEISLELEDNFIENQKKFRFDLDYDMD